MNKTDHQKITRAAIKEYSKLFASPNFKSLLEEHENTVIRATETEDVWYRNWDRPFHWHFYKHKNNSNPDSFTYLGSRITLYSHHVYNEYIDKFNDCLNALPEYNRETFIGKFSYKLALKHMLECVGGILHHIQDMSTPSHVAPVFHGSPAPGDFKAIHDQFETFSGDNIDTYLNDSFSQNDLQEKIDAFMPNDTFKQIYESAAEQTLLFLHTTKFTATVDNHILTDVPCSWFWQEYDNDQSPLKGNETAGFGQYGPLEKAFGKVNLKKNNGGEEIDEGYNDIINGQQWNIKFSDYSHIYTESLKQMVVNSVWCLRVVDTLCAKI